MLVMLLVKKSLIFGDYDSRTGSVSENRLQRYTFFLNNRLVPREFFFRFANINQSEPSLLYYYYTIGKLFPGILRNLKKKLYLCPVKEKILIPSLKYITMKEMRQWMMAAILTICGANVLTSCSEDDSPAVQTDEVELQLQKMTLREKVGQLFYVRPECLDTTIHFNLLSGIDGSADDITKIKLQAVNATMLRVNEKYPVGGVILYAHNIEDEAQLAAFIPQIRALKGSPLLCIDEEGGRVARIGRNSNFNVKTYESMGAIGATGDPANAYECGNTIGTYLHRYGFDIDFAPVADVNTNPENIVIGARAFSDNPEVAAPMVVNYLQGLKDAGVTGCIKHFPGHGDTKADTHYGYAQSLKTWDEMRSCEMTTFKAGIQWGAQLIMTAHISVPNVTGSDVPATMSPVILQDKLRGELGYQNVIITDAMEMGAITKQYKNAEAAVGTLLAGADIVLGPQNFVEAFDAVIKAVENGTLTEQRIDQSVRRVLRMKKQLN